jgi:hypothetical protein
MKAMAIHTAVAVTSIAIYSVGNAEDAKVPCQKVADCAQALVEVASKLTDANKELSKRVSALEDDLAKYKETNGTDLQKLNDSMPSTVFSKLEFVVRYYEPQTPRNSNSHCEANEKLVAASCLGGPFNSGQASVGPVFYEGGNVPQDKSAQTVTCRAYNDPNMQVTAFAVCARMKP